MLHAVSNINTENEQSGVPLTVDNEQKKPEIVTIYNNTFYAKMVSQYSIWIARYHRFERVSDMDRAEPSVRGNAHTSGKQPTDIRRLFLLDVGQGQVMPGVERRPQSPGVAFQPATRSIMTAVGILAPTKKAETVASNKRKRYHLCTVKHDRKYRVNCDVWHIQVSGEHRQSVTGAREI